MKKIFIMLMAVGLTSNLMASEKTLYFGKEEIKNGALKVADNKTLNQGDVVNLKLFLVEGATFVSGPYYMATEAHIYVRFNEGNFKELSNLPKGHYNPRGPYINWESDAADVELIIPKDADRVELYALYDRVTYSGSSCYLAYDMMECPDYFAINSEYVSNLGKNFSVRVQR